MSLDKSHYFFKCEMVRWVKKGERAVLLQPEGGKYYRLNQTATLIWDYCDGSKRIKDIACILRRRFRGNTSARVESDVMNIILDFYRKGLIYCKRQ